MINPIISIAIPIYNGEEFFTQTLDSIVAQIQDKPVELVLCDDKSNDKTLEIAKDYAQKYPFIRVFENDKNLGMDDNFLKVASLSNGQYLWFSGQDDIFCDRAIDKILDVIEKKLPDFIYMNFSRNSHNMDKVIMQRMLEIDEDIYCPTYKEFLDVTGVDHLPSFLPSFIMKKELWDTAETEQFKGTQFIQLGAFFSQLKNMKLYIVSDVLIKGRVPENRWQANSLKLLDILSGDLEVIVYAYKHYGVVEKTMYKTHYKKVRKWILNTLIDARHDKHIISDKIKKRFKKILTIKDFFITKILINTPAVIYKSKLGMKVLRVLR